MRDEMKVAIVGQKIYPCKQDIDDLVGTLGVGATVVVAGKTGVARWAKDAAERRGLSVIVVERYGRLAVLLRNHDVARIADQVYAFCADLQDTDRVFHLLNFAQRYNKPIHIIEPHD